MVLLSTWTLSEIYEYVPVLFYCKYIKTHSYWKTACGTRVYAAPEVIDPGSRGHYDEKVDSWSIGVVVFKLYEFGLYTTPCSGADVVLGSLRVSPSLRGTSTENLGGG